MHAVRMLAEEIGPRPACSEAEDRAAGWCSERLRSSGLTVTLEPFDSRPSATPWTSGYLCLAAAAALFIGPLPLVGFVLSVAALVLYARDVEGRPLLPPRRARSVNVVARSASSDDPALVVVAELDSGRASPRFNPRWPPGPRGWLVVVHAALVAVPLVSGVAWVAQAATVLPASLWLAGSALAGVLLAAGLADLRSERRDELLRGANDNATGVQAVLDLAARFPGGNVWWVLLGSGESGQIGMQAFLERHAHDLGAARILAVRGLGGGELDAPFDEGLLRLRRADPALLDAAVEAGAASSRLRSVQTASAVALTHGFRAATIAGIDDRGSIAGHGWRAADAVDEFALGRAVDLVARVVEVVTGEPDVARTRSRRSEGGAPS